MYVCISAVSLPNWLAAGCPFVCMSVCLFHSSNHYVKNNLPYSFQTGSTVAATMSIDDRESTKLVLEVVAVAESNGLKLPREFGLLLNQVRFSFSRLQFIIAATASQTLYLSLFFDLITCARM